MRGVANFSASSCQNLCNGRTCPKVVVREPGGRSGGLVVPGFAIMWVVLLLSGGAFAAHLLLHYVLFLLAAHPEDAAGIGHELNQFERRQLVEWQPKIEDFLKHDDEHRTYDDVFGPYRSETDNYSTCVFPRLPFTHRYASDYLLLKLKDGMRGADRALPPSILAAGGASTSPA